MKLNEELSRIKSIMGIVTEDKKTKPLSYSVLKVPKITNDYVKSNNKLLSQIQNNSSLKDIDLKLNPNDTNFISKLSKKLQDNGVEPYFYEYANKDGSGGVGGGLTFYIPNTNVGVSYEPGTFGASLGNLSLGYTPSSKQMSANLIIPIGK